MRILSVLDIGYPVVGGAQITHQTYLRLLARRFGHDTLYLDRARVRRPIRGEAPRLDYFRDWHELKQKLDAWRPDVIVAAFTTIHWIARLSEVPYVAALNSYEYCPPSEAETRSWRLTLSHRYPTATERERALSAAAAIMVNSQHLRQRLERLAGYDACVVYPPFEQRALPSPRAGDGTCVTGVCGYPHKGAEIFLELARRFPDQPFLLVGAVGVQHADALRTLPNVETLRFSPPRSFLARSKVVLVPSQWDEPFGRIAVEAMASGIPVLASRRAGLEEIVGDSDLGVSDFRDQDAWAARLAALLDSSATRRTQAETGLALAERFVGEACITRLDHLLRGVAGSPGPRPRGAGRPSVALVGSSACRTAFGLINSTLADGLQSRGKVRLELLSSPEASEAPEPVADVVVQHDYRHDFGQLPLPALGAVVAIRTWDFGPYPPAWVERINRAYDELWVYSRWVRRNAIAGGVSPGRVRVMPLGFDPQIFTHDGPPLELPTAKAFRFLFVGSAVPRKGIDILLSAYRSAFRPDDDVCLVIKDNPEDVFYHGIREHDAVARSDGSAPEIVLVDRYLSDTEMGGLYRACQLGVFPYRAEGFAMPILEAMACGTPSIVPRFGACLDFCSEATSLLIEAKRISLPVVGEFAFNTFGFRETIEEVDFCEVPVAGLAQAMHSAYRQWQRSRGAGLRRRSAAGAARALERFKWSDTVARVERRIEALARRRTPVRLAAERRAHALHEKLFAAARELYLSPPNG